MTAIYLDSSALIKLVVDERESAALRHWLQNRPDATWFTSALSEVEVLRAVGRVHPPALDAARAVLDLVVQLEIDENIRRAAATIPPVGLRSLDAIHVASALLLRDETEAVLVYDTKLAAACARAGLKVESPS